MRSYTYRLSIRGGGYGMLVICIDGRGGERLGTYVICMDERGRGMATRVPSTAGRERDKP